MNLSMIPGQVEKVAAEHNLPSIDLSPQAEQSTYFIARILMEAARFLSSLIGFGHNPTVVTTIYATLVFFLSLLIGWILQWLIVLITQKVSKHFNSDIYQILHRRKFFSKSSRIVPALVFLILIELTLTHRVTLSTWLTRLTCIYIVLIVCNSLSVLASAIWEHIDAIANKKRLPLKGLVQLVQGAVWIIGAIVIVAILVNKSPATLLAGLGAFAAVLMLVFKDSILGVVAGVQLSENDSLHVGDWIKVNGTDANGTVQEVTLTSVKVRNWDKTVTSVPPYSLVTGSFTNYRPMSESNTRLIKRSINIDADSIQPNTDDMLTKFKQIPLMKDWIEKKIAQRNAGKTCDVSNPAGLVDGSIETNLGVFRAYAKLYLDGHPMLAKPGDINYCFVSTLPQTSTGIPFQVYCFTGTSNWLEYEAIQDSIMEHLLGMLHWFGLYTFEYPTGRDTIIEGWLSPGRKPENVEGIPFEFEKNQELPTQSPTPSQNQSSGQDTTTASDTEAAKK